MTFTPLELKADPDSKGGIHSAEVEEIAVLVVRRIKTYVTIPNTEGAPQAFVLTGKHDTLLYLPTSLEAISEVAALIVRLTEAAKGPTK